MRVLLTRPDPQNAATAARLEARGHQAILAPLIAFHPQPDGLAKPLSDEIAATILTSQNAVRAIKNAPVQRQLRSLPAFCVGDATASAARNAGFASVETADGDASALVRQLGQRPELKGRRLVHICGRDRAGDLGGRLAGLGIALDEVIVYRMDAASEPPPGLYAAARPGGADVAMVYSPRTGRILRDLVTKADTLAGLRALPTVAISAAAGAPLEAAGWENVAVAERPDEAAMLSAIGAVRPGT